MASGFNDFFGKRGLRYDRTTAPDMIERISAFLAMALLAAAIIAVWKGRPQWPTLPWQLWLHLATLAIALAITPVMLLRRRGDIPHRMLGWTWAVCMLVTAVISLDIRMVNNGEFSFIHLLSAFTIVGVPALILSARRRDIRRHRSQARGFVIGALLVAGFFTFPFNRLMGNWLFS